MTTPHPDDDLLTEALTTSLTALGARGTSTEITRDQRSRRTADLLQRAARAGGPERSVLLDEVVVLNCRVADAVAARYRDRGVALEDLQQAAYEGLVKAVLRFDGDQAEDLLTFAVPTIRGEVQRYFRDRSWMVRPPRRVQELQGRLSTAVDELQTELGREPSATEVAEHLGVDAGEYAEAVAAFGCFHPPSLDRPVGDGGDVTMGDLLPDDREDHAAVEARSLLRPGLRGLDERDRRLLFLRFYEERSQREIADELGLSPAQVSRHLDRVLRLVRLAVDPGSRPRRGHLARSA